MRNVSWVGAYGAIGLVVVFMSCAPPPPKINRNPGAGGSGGKANSTSGGMGASAGSDTPGSGGSSDGTAGKGGKGGKGGQGGSSGSGAASGSGGGGGTSSGLAGIGGTNPDGGTSGESGAGGAPGGEGGESSGGSSGTAGIGNAGGEGGDSGTVWGGKSDLPEPPTTGVSKPDGTPGNLDVLDWAGFKGAVSFTFDDAVQSQIDNYAALNAVGVRMTFYLVCANDGSKMAWTTAALDGHELGNHTMHHCLANGTGCGWGAFSTVDGEIDDCQAHLKSAFGVDAYTMASPMGDSAWQTPASERFLANRGVYDNPAGVGPNDGTSPYNLPCHIAAEDEKAVGGFNVVTDSVRTNGKWRIILNHSLGNNDGYHPVDPNEVVAAMTYARDLGDVWVDSVVKIAAYWRAQKVVSTAVPTTSGDEQTWSWTLPDHFPPGQYLRVTVDGGTVTQGATTLEWNDHGYYEIALDAGAVTIAP